MFMAERIVFFDKVRNRSAGIKCSFVDLTDMQNIEKNIRPETRMIW